MTTKPQMGKRKFNGAVRSIDDEAKYLNRILLRLMHNNLEVDEKAKLVAEGLAALNRIMQSNRAIDEIGELAREFWEQGE